MNEGRDGALLAPLTGTVLMLIAAAVFLFATIRSAGAIVINPPRKSKPPTSYSYMTPLPGSGLPAKCPRFSAPHPTQGDIERYIRLCGPLR